ncbi:ABC transporter substrate-binding protein [Variovorax sp. WS11]|uniref:PaaI family thioesterase n=1 Tax=Variovorax sp. WS11 TaxID=1105204 RepID=UPI000D0D1DB2|nr:PaaI family thioesterase [Variovorax sp. WS11]PSL86248.1 ABC transporter substrate-binding protein [Variovorax sp. WS11]
MSAAGFADAPGGADNPLLEYLGIVLVEVSAGHATFQIEVDARHLNRQGSLQGGVAATLLDAACGYAGLAAREGEAMGQAVTVSLAINYLRRAGPGRLRATGKVTKTGRSLYFSSGELLSESGELVATAQGAFKRSPAPSSPGA